MTFRPSRRDSVVALAGVLAGAAVATAAAVAAWPGPARTGPSPTARGTSAASSPAAAGTLTPDPVDETLRPNEIVLPAQKPYTSGKIVLVPLRMACGFSAIIGTHGEEDANGQYCLVRVALTGDDTYTHTFNVRKTALTTTAGDSVPPTYEAQEVKRQPLEIAEVGSHDRYEFDIYYDVPRDAKVNGFTFSDGEGGPTVRAPLPVRVWPTGWTG